jgi:hypothetical protein
MTNSLPEEKACWEVKGIFPGFLGYGKDSTNLAKTVERGSFFTAKDGANTTSEDTAFLGPPSSRVPPPTFPHEGIDWTKHQPLTGSHSCLSCHCYKKLCNLLHAVTWLSSFGQRHLSSKPAKPEFLPQLWVATDRPQ